MNFSKAEAKLLKPGQLVFPVTGHWANKPCIVSQVKLGDLTIGNVWVEVIIEETGTKALFGGEELSLKQIVKQAPVEAAKLPPEIKAAAKLAGTKVAKEFAETYVKPKTKKKPKRRRRR